MTTPYSLICSDMFYGPYLDVATQRLRVGAFKTFHIGICPLMANAAKEARRSLVTYLISELIDMYGYMKGRVLHI